MNNNGKYYERITQAVFQHITAQSEVPNTIVKHNINLDGKFCSHQVDVYWEFKIGGILYRNVVECKDYESASIQQNALFAFKAILDDLGYPTGIFVAKTKFQKGALEYAKQHGIILFQLSKEADYDPIEVKEGGFALLKLRPEDWTLEVTNFEVTNHNMIFQVDTDWLQSFEKERRAAVLDYKMPPQRPAQVKFYDDNNVETDSLIKLTQTYLGDTSKYQKTTRKKISHKFTEATYIEIDLKLFPFIKIDSISFEITTEKKPMIESPMKVKGFTGFVLKNILDNKSERYLLKD